MSQLTDIHTFIELSRAARTPAELDRLILDITKEMGFDYYALLLRPSIRDALHDER